jgi:hypothetical protein
MKVRFNAPVRRQSPQVGAGVNRDFSAIGLALHESPGRCPGAAYVSRAFGANRYTRARGAEKEVEGAKGAT